MKTTLSIRTALVMAAATVLFAACGGGGRGPSVAADPAVEGTDVPTSATTSSAGAFAFVSTVAATSDNSAEPLRVGNAVLATSDTEEPDPSI